MNSVRPYYVLFILFAASVIAGCSNPAPEPGAPADTQAEAGPTAEEATQVAQAAPDPPEVVAEKFIEAGNSGDKETFLSLLTEEARTGFGGEADLSADEGFDEYTIGETTIDGETAAVAVDAVDDGEEVDVTLRMRQENAAWRVFAMDVDLGDGLVMKMNFEQLGSMMQSMGESMAEAMGEGLASAFETSPEEIAAQRAQYQALRAVPADEYEASWKSTDDFRGTPAKEALTTLAESVGLPVDFGDHEEALSNEVTVETAGLSTLEAIDRIAGEVNVYPVFPDPVQEAGAMLQAMASALAQGMTELLEATGVTIEGHEAESATDEPDAQALQFAAGERRYPIEYVGPFAVEITGVDENVPHTTGALHLVVRTYGLDPAILALLENYSDGTTFDAIHDAQGRALNDEDVMYLGGGTSDGIRYVDAYSIQIMNLIREVSAIAKVAGVQRVQRPAGVVEFVFYDASEGSKAEANGFSATIDTARDYTQLSVATPDGFDTANVAALALADDAEDNPVLVSYVSTTAWEENQIDVSLNLEEAPASLRVKLVTDMEVHEYPFEFAEIPLEHAGEQPEKVEELTFEGAESPVTVEFVEVTEPDDSFAKILVRVTNHSNKDAEMVSLNLVYLDENGNEIDDFPSTLGTSFEFIDGEMVSVPSAAKNSTREVETTAFGMPEGTQDMRIEVTMIEFVDGTEWQTDF